MIRKVRIEGYRAYRKFELFPNEDWNLIVGANESGKSTLIEAITLALTGRVDGRWASEALHPHWFNRGLTSEFVDQLRSGENPALPTILIELYLADSDELQRLAGANNSDVPTRSCPGVALRVEPSAEYQAELEEWRQNPSDLLPVEYYTVDWRSFADEVLTTRPRLLVTAQIDSRTVRGTRGVDYHMRQILRDQMDPSDGAAISLAYRRVKTEVTTGPLAKVNEKMAAKHRSLHDKPIGLAMDQTARTSWEGAVTPHVSGIPFSLAGQGQQATIKISLALNREAERASIVTIEEPENHLSFTSLGVLLGRMASLAGDRQQLFLTTHSSFVLNRLGLGALHLLSPGQPSQRLSGLSEETVRYFQKLPGYDTLRMVLADQIVLVEGPSDEIIFERIFSDIYDKRPIEKGIDVISVRGLSFDRCLELCSALGKRVAVVRDNDGLKESEHRDRLNQWLENGSRELFVGAIADGVTLEPQLVAANGQERTRALLELSDRADLDTWMSRNKTEAAIRLAESSSPLNPPDYLRAAAEFSGG